MGSTQLLVTCGALAFCSGKLSPAAQHLIPACQTMTLDHRYSSVLYNRGRERGGGGMERGVGECSKREGENLS